MVDTAKQPDTPLMQDPAFVQALRQCGQTPIRLPQGQWLLHRWIFGVPVAMLPRAAPPFDLAAQLQSRGLARTPLILSPETPCPLPGALRLHRPRARAVLPLHRSETTARALLHQKWRHQLRRAEGAGIALTFGPFDAKGDLGTLRIAEEQARKRGYAQWPSALTAAFAMAAPDQTHLLTAHFGGLPIAQMLFLTHGRHATYHLGHTTPEGRKLHAHNLLLWKGARHLANLGYATLDLGLLDKATPGLTRFKMRTGAEMVETGGTWLYWRPFARAQRAALTA